ncbi:MAG: FecR family protein [Planctomycetota bacterium]|nr:FecR family protein [Planctomycetota bacterium]
MNFLRGVISVGLCSVVLATCLHAAVAVPPVGYVVSLAATDDEAEAAPATVTCRRADQVLEAYDGFPLQPGDIITSGKERVLIAFLDESAVTLDKESSIRVEAYPYPAQRKSTTVSVESGSAFFVVTPRPDGAHFMVRMRDHTIDVKGTSFLVYINWDATAGTYTSTISVTKGQVKLCTSATGANFVDIMDGTQLALTLLHKNVAGFTGADTTIQQKNLTKDQIAALEADYVNKLSVSTGKAGEINITSIAKNHYGQVITTSLKEVNGVMTKRTTTFKDGKITTEKFSETTSGGITKASLSQLYMGYKIGAKLVGNDGTATVKDGATKDLYKGTIKITSEGLRIVDATTKTGKHIVIVIGFLLDGSYQKSVSTFAAGATTGTQVTTTTGIDGKATVVTEQVTNVWTGTDFANVPGTAPVVTGGGALPPGFPAPPDFLTPGDHNVDNPTNPNPVSR